MTKVVLKNGSLVTKDGVEKKDIVIEDGKIKEIVDKSPEKGKEVVDLKGKYILPGLIDSHVHFRTPGGEVKEDFMTGSRAAASGGITTVLDMPNTTPATTNLQVLEDKIKIASKQSIVNFGFHFGASIDNLEDMKRVKGVGSVKIYMGSSTGNLLVDDNRYLEEMFKEVPKLFTIHAEDEELMKKNMEEFSTNLEDPAVHSDIRSQQVAYNAVKAALHLSKKYEHPVHICHVSSQMELDVIKKFKDKNVTCEATPHHLFFTIKDYADKGNLVKMNPPIRSQEDQDALWQAIDEGVVDVIGTDHAPHLLDEKLKRYIEAPSGVPGVETMLPLLLDAVNNGRLNLSKLVELTSYTPAKIFKIKNKGEIKEGYDADITVVDMEQEMKVENKKLFENVGGHRLMVGN